MKCDNCSSHESVEPYTFIVYAVGIMQMVLCVACRLQFQIQLWKGHQVA